jgi:hypothetical protein
VQVINPLIIIKKIPKKKKVLLSDCEHNPEAIANNPETVSKMLEESIHRHHTGTQAFSSHSFRGQYAGYYGDSRLYSLFSSNLLYLDDGGDSYKSSYVTRKSSTRQPACTIFKHVAQIVLPRLIIYLSYSSHFLP